MGARIFLGTVPTTAYQRVLLRAHATDLVSGLKPVPAAISVAFNLPGSPAVDLAIVAPGLTLAGPVILETQLAAVDPDSERLLALAREQRSALLRTLPEFASADAIAAIVFAPTLPAENPIVLDIDDHRARIKVLGFDELVGLTLLALGDQRAETGSPWLLADHDELRLWHDGARFLFPLTPPRYQVRLANNTSVPLYEGENVIGRRRSARRYEHRVTCTDDDLISTDHAVLSYLDDGALELRDMSKNGTLLVRPGQAEQRLHNETTTVEPGTMLRVGSTTLHLEAAQGDA